MVRENKDCSGSNFFTIIRPPILTDYALSSIFIFYEVGESDNGYGIDMSSLGSATVSLHGL